MLSGFALKLIALAAMACDHAAVALIGSGEVLYGALRFAGGLAFPIYAFLLTEGFSRTGNRRVYFEGMAMFAVISEIPFDMAVYGTYWHAGHQNVFFTLAAGIAVMAGMDAAAGRGRSFWRTAAAVLAGAVVSLMIRADYDWSGILLIAVLYAFRQERGRRELLGCAASFLCRLTAPLAFIPIHMYSGRRGPKAKWLFYWFYPIHLLILGLLRMHMA